MDAYFCGILTVMKRSILLVCLGLYSAVMAIAQPANMVSDSVLFAGEKHFKNVQQLTFGGDNAEAYWSFDGKHIIFQRTNAKEGLKCDQIFVGKLPATGE